MTDSSVPYDRDPDPDPDPEDFSHYDAMPDGSADVADDPPVLPEFEGVDITSSEGPDLELGDDLDTGAAMPEE